MDDLPIQDVTIAFTLVITRCCAVNQKPDELMSGEANGYVVAQIFYDIFEVLPLQYCPFHTW